MTYKGWIPVASGFLSFSNIRGQIIDGRCHDEPEMEGALDLPSGCVYRSTRYLIDRPLASIRLVPFFSSDERYDFECRMRIQASGKDDVLVGKVIAHPSIEAHSAELIKNEINPSPGVYRNCLGWVVDFELDRTGCISIDWGSLKAGDVAQIVDLEDGAIPEEQAELMLTFESFSFLKDLIHSHKFHSVDDDSIVVPFKVPANDDVVWRDETAKNIHRAIVSSLRNSPGQIELTNSLGKICYLKTFLGFASTPFSKSLAESLPNLEKTVEIRLQARSIRAGSRDFVTTTWVAVCLALLATALPLIQLLQMPCIKGLTLSESCSASFLISPLALSLVGFVLENWTGAMATCLGVLLFIGYIAVRPSIINLYSHRTGNESFDWQVMRLFYGLALTRGRYIALFWVTILFVIVVSLLCVFLAFVIR